jgi:alpha-glucosidase
VIQKLSLYGLSALLVVLVFAQNVFAQTQNVGRLLSYKKIKGGIEGRTTHAIFDIHAYAANTIRVRISKNKKLNDFSYALLSNQVPAYDVKITDNGNSIELATDSITAVIEKQPVLRIIFKNKNGAVINEDMEGESFGTGFTGNKVNSYKKLQEAERFVGLGEVLGNLDKKGIAFTLNNTDTYKYGDPRLSMYISIPFYIGIHHKQVYGLFYNNTYKTFFNFASSTPYTSISAEGGDADYFFFYDQSVEKIIEHYTSVTGRMPLPPKWALGYHQSRCSYYPQQKVEWIGATFRRKKIPIDCIVLDADYQYGYEPFRIDSSRFPDMPGLAAHLSKMNIELTASVYPGVKIDSTYHSYNDGLKKNVFIKYNNGQLFETEIAPLRCYLPDYTNPAVREWWIEKMKWLPDNGIHGYWNDMNEPAIAGSYLPDNLLFDFDGRKAGALEAKNVYGFQMARSSFESALKYGNGRRPFVLTRSAFAGVQRYSAVWSGDNIASNEGLLSGVLLNSQMGLSGLPFVGPDLGGYIGDGSKDLFKRWMQVGIFSPFVRNHKEFLALANEPWSYGEEAEAISKTWIGFRYRLMPYIYSAFYEAAETGMPVARSLCIDDPFDDKVYDNLYQYQFLFGDAMMVVPVTTEEKSKKIYLPKGEWYDLFSDEKIEGGEEITKEIPIYKIPLFVKASSIIPVQTLVQSAREKSSDTLLVHIYNGKEKNSFELYEDDGNSMAYKNGNYCERKIGFDPVNRQIIFSKEQGNFISAFKKIQLIFHGFDISPAVMQVNNTTMQAIKIDLPLLDVFEDLQNYYDKNYLQSLRNAEKKLATYAMVVENNKNEIQIQWQ